MTELPPTLCLRYLQSVTQDEPVLILELLELFVEDGAMYIEMLSRADSQEEVVYAIHTLKGSAGQIGAERLEALGGEAERLARGEETWRAAAQLQERLREEFEAVCDAIEEYRIESLRG